MEYTLHDLAHIRTPIWKRMCIDEKQSFIALMIDPLRPLNISLMEKLCSSINDQQFNIIRRWRIERAKYKIYNSYVSTYMWFVRYNYKTIMYTHPDWRLSDIDKSLREIWSNYTIGEKSVYIRLYNMDKHRFMVEQRNLDIKLHAKMLNVRSELLIAATDENNTMSEDELSMVYGTHKNNNLAGPIVNIRNPISMLWRKLRDHSIF